MFESLGALVAAALRLRLIPDTRRDDTARFEAVPVRSRDGRDLLLEIVANQYWVRESLFIHRMEEWLRRSNLELQQFAFAASHDSQEPLRTVTSFSQCGGKVRMS
jgi:light-regulated signal transduction histidine kinase (bacteriophytochrome)